MDAININCTNKQTHCIYRIFDSSRKTMICIQVEIGPSQSLQDMLLCCENLIEAFAKLKADGPSNFVFDPSN